MLRVSVCLTMSKRLLRKAVRGVTTVRRGRGSCLGAPGRRGRLEPTELYFPRKLDCNYCTEHDALSLIYVISVWSVSIYNKKQMYVANKLFILPQPCCLIIVLSRLTGSTASDAFQLPWKLKVDPLFKSVDRGGGRHSSPQSALYATVAKWSSEQN